MRVWVGKINKIQLQMTANVGVVRYINCLRRVRSYATNGYKKSVHCMLVTYVRRLPACF